MEKVFGIRKIEHVCIHKRSLQKEREQGREGKTEKGKRGREVGRMDGKDGGREEGREEGKKGGRGGGKEERKRVMKKTRQRDRGGTNGNWVLGPGLLKVTPKEKLIPKGKQLRCGEHSSTCTSISTPCNT